MTERGIEVFGDADWARDKNNKPFSGGYVLMDSLLAAFAVNG